jgi:predicted NACHT family NTPase
LELLDFEAPLKHWNSLVPFFIRLRSWVDKGFPAVKDFVQPIARNILDGMPGDWVRQQLDSGCALVLIDGVDEMPRPKRQTFFEDLQKLVTEFPNAIYITTSRPAGLKDENGEEWVEWENWMKAEQFGNCLMEPMTLPVIEKFINRWHSALPEPSQQEDKDPKSIGSSEFSMIM